MRSMEFRIPYGAAARQRKKAEIARHFKVDGPFLFLHVHLGDNRSEFTAPLDVKIWKEDDDCVAEVYGAVAIANTIASSVKPSIQFRSSSA